MTVSGGSPERYQIRINGHLDVAWSDWFDGLVISQRVDGTTTLTGLIVDQAELFGLLGRLRDLGATLLLVERIPEDDLAGGRTAHPGADSP
jgi:hypothetical protein